MLVPCDTLMPEGSICPEDINIPQDNVMFWVEHRPGTRNLRLLGNADCLYSSLTQSDSVLPTRAQRQFQAHCRALSVLRQQCKERQKSICPVSHESLIKAK